MGFAALYPSYGSLWHGVASTGARMEWPQSRNPLRSPHPTRRNNSTAAPMKSTGGAKAAASGLKP